MILHTLIWIGVMSELYARREDGPECPRFDYEYRVVEKLIHLQDKYDELAKLVEAQRKDIDFLSTQSYLNEIPVVVAEIQESNPQTLTNGQAMVFTNAVTNIGNAYDTNLGHFEAPVNGTYLFSVTICISSNTHVSFAIMKESEEIEKSFTGDNDWYTCASGTTATYMSAKEKIWVKISNVYKGGQTKSDANARSSFTGVLINTCIRQ